VSTFGIIEIPLLPPKKRPRGRPFPKGVHHATEFKPGQSGNPGGKPKVHQTMKMNQERMLARTAPAEVCGAVGAKRGSTWAEVLAAALFRRAALGDVSALREIRETTEGRLPVSARVDNQIDYSAGKNAIELLMAKLEPREG
jgi:hypothetical protein